MTDDAPKIPDIDEYLINGQLFLTRTQYRALLREAWAFDVRTDKPLAPLVGDIPVYIVVPGTPISAGDGSMVACFDDQIYVYPEDLSLTDPEPPDEPPPVPPVAFGGGVQK